MEDGEKLSPEQIRAFLEGSDEVHFRMTGTNDRIGMTGMTVPVPPPLSA